MSENNRQNYSFKSRFNSLLELQILRFFTTLAVLTIIFVLVLRFVQQTSLSSDKIKPVEATVGPASIETMFDFSQINPLANPRTKSQANLQAKQPLKYSKQPASEQPASEQKKSEDLKKESY